LRKSVESGIRYKRSGRRIAAGTRQGGWWLKVDVYAAALSWVVREVQKQRGLSDSTVAAAGCDGRFISRRGGGAAAKSTRFSVIQQPGRPQCCKFCPAVQKCFLSKLHGSRIVFQMIFWYKAASDSEADPRAGKWIFLPLSALKKAKMLVLRSRE
jgi:hypothetical protein